MTSLRDAFPFFAHHPDWIYLDSAATAQKPQVMIDALQQHFVHGAANVHRAAHQLANRVTREFEDARATVAGFIHAASADQIVWTRGSTEAINLVANSWGQQHIQAGDVVLISALEHHANIVPWQQLCQQKGAELRVLPITEQGELDERCWDTLFDRNVKLLAITAMSNVLGTLTPLPRLIARARAVGATVLVDAAQAIAHQPIDVQQLDCDFLVFSGHKIYGPSGIGVLYGKRELFAAMPPWQLGGEMVQHVSWERSQFQAAPLRFEAGTPAISDAIALAASIRFVQQLDRAAIAQHEQQLLRDIDHGLDQMTGVQRISVATPRSAIASFVIRHQHHADVASQLDQRHIAVRAGTLCAMPLLQQLHQSHPLQHSGLLRASLGLYNNSADVQRFLQAVHDIARGNVVHVAAPSFPPNIIERLQNARSWDSRYRVLLQQAQHHHHWSADERTQAKPVTGCESATWLQHSQRDQRFYFALDSDARIVIGLAAVVLELVNGKSRDDILAIDFVEQFKSLGISGQLSPSRSNGLFAIIKTIQQIVAV